MPEQLLTLEQVAEYLNVDKFTVYRLLADQKKNDRELAIEKLQPEKKRYAVKSLRLFFPSFHVFFPKARCF